MVGGFLLSPKTRPQAKTHPKAMFDEITGDDDDGDDDDDI